MHPSSPGTDTYWLHFSVLVLVTSVALSSCSTELFRGGSQRSGLPADEWVEIQSGTFLMGDASGDDDEEPVHRVQLKSYWISRFEVTNADYERCVLAGVCTAPKIGGRALPDHPVVNVSWEQARAFCSWAGGRLPTEAEWEHAGRGGLQGARYPWGDEQVSCEPGAVNGAQFGYCSGTTAAVGSFAPNDYGLYDMAGNAWEWVADWYAKDYYQVSADTNPSGPERGRYKVIRGGGWNYSVYGLRVAYRSTSFPESQANFIGFRCVRDNPPG